MSLEDLLQELEGYQEELAAMATGSETVAEVSVTLCFQAYAETETKEFPFTGKADKKEAMATAREYLFSVGKSGNSAIPTLGILTSIHYKNILAGNMKGKLSQNFDDFVSGYFSDSNLSKMVKDNKLTEGERKLITGPLPFTLVISKAYELGILDNKPRWCKLIQEVNQWSKVKQDRREAADGKSYDKRIWVVQEVYKSKKEAQTAAAEIESNQGDSSNETPQLSQTATDNGYTPESLESGYGVSIRKMLEDGMAKSVIATQHGIAQSDVDLIAKNEIPF